MSQIPMLSRSPSLPPSPSMPRSMRPALLAAVLVSGFAAPAAHAQAGAFLRYGSGPRSLALGGALAADVSGLASAYHNPALAPEIEGQHLDAAAFALTQDRQVQSLQFGTPMAPRAGVSVGVVHAAVTGIDGRDGSGYATGELRTDEFAIFTAFGLRLTPKVSAGVGLQVFRSTLAEGVRPALSVGLDVGVLVRPARGVAVALVLDDALAGYTYDSSGLYGEGGARTTERFPTRLRAGASVERGRTVALVEIEEEFEFRNAREERVVIEDGLPRLDRRDPAYTFAHTTLRIGAEHRIGDALRLRVGADGLLRDGVAAAVRPGAGAAFERAAGPLRLRVDYGVALDPYGTGLVHAAGLRVLL